MSTPFVDHPTSELLSVVVNHFLFERKAAGLSPATLRFYAYDLARFVQFNQDCHVSALTSDSIRAFILDLQDTGHNPGGVHGHYRCVKALLNWYWDEYEPTWRNPIKRVVQAAPRLNPKPGVSLESVRALVASCTTAQSLRDKSILLFLLDTGCRASECTAVNVRDVDLVAGAVRIYYAKGGQGRTVYLGELARKSLRRYLKSRVPLSGVSPLFVTDDGDRLSFSGLRQVIRRRAHAAGVDCPGLHDFRRAFALTMLRNGADLKTISKLLGHASIVVTERYLAQDDTDLLIGHRRWSPVDSSSF